MTLHMAIHLFSLPALLGGRNMEKARNVSPVPGLCFAFLSFEPLFLALHIFHHHIENFPLGGAVFQHFPRHVRVVIDT